MPAVKHECYAKLSVKVMDDIGVVMTPFGDVVTVILVANSYVVDFFLYFYETLSHK